MSESNEVLRKQEEFVLEICDLKNTERHQKIVSLEIGELSASVGYVTGGTSSSSSDSCRINLVKIPAGSLSRGLLEVKKRVESGKGADDVTVVCSGCLKNEDLELIKTTFNPTEILRYKKSQCIGKIVHHMLSKMEESAAILPYNDPDIAARMKMAFGYSPPEDPNAKEPTLFPALVCSMGDSIEFFKVDENGTCQFESRLLGNGAVSILSLGKIVAGCETIDELIARSNEGNSQNVSTMFKESFTGTYGILNAEAIGKFCPFDIEVFPMGKIIRDNVSEPRHEDVLTGLVKESYRNALSKCNQLARQHDLVKTYFTGALFTGNNVLVDYLDRMPYSCVFSGQKPNNMRLLKYENYLPVIGAMMNII